MQPANNSRPNTGPFGAPWWALMIAAVVYVLSPIDLIPEFPFGCIGMVDDLGAIAFGIYCLVKMFSGGGTAPVPTSVTIVQEPRQVAVETRPEPPILLAAPVVRRTGQVQVSPPAGGGMSAVFVVQVIDDDGAVESIEVEARDADHARATVSALGADGRIGKVRLKRLHANPGEDRATDLGVS